MPLVLNSASGSLALTQDENGVGGWCQVHLATSGVRRFLGAETLGSIAKKLLAFLANRSSGPRWIFSLAELHTSVYGAHLAGESVLRFQDATGSIFAELVLKPSEAEAWIPLLSCATRE